VTPFFPLITVANFCPPTGDEQKRFPAFQDLQPQGGGCRAYMDVFTARLEKPGTVSAAFRADDFFKWTEVQNTFIA